MSNAFIGHVESEGKIIYKSVNGAYNWHTEPGGLNSWDGHFEIESGELPQGGECTLHFSKGEVGKIIITDFNPGNPIVHFQGSGAIQDAED